MTRKIAPQKAFDRERLLRAVTRARSKPYSDPRTGANLGAGPGAGATTGVSGSANDERPENRPGRTRGDGSKAARPNCGHDQIGYGRRACSPEGVPRAPADAQRATWDRRSAEA